MGNVTFDLGSLEPDMNAAKIDLASEPVVLKLLSPLVLNPSLQVG